MKKIFTILWLILNMCKKKLTLSSGSLLCVLGLWLPFSALASHEVITTEIRHQHPRLYLDSHRIHQIKKSFITTADSNNKWLKIKVYADQIIANNRVDGGSKDAQLLLFTHLISDNVLYFSQAKAVFQAMRKPFYEETDDQVVCPKLQTAALIYDWEYSLLTKAEKVDYKLYILNAINWLKTAGYLSLDTVIGGHGITAHECALIGLIAIKQNSILADAYLAPITDHLFNHYLPFYRFLSEQDGSFHMGWEYTRYYHLGIIDFFDVWRSATNENLFLQNDWLIKSQRFQSLYGINDEAEPFKTGDIHVTQLGYENRLFALKIAQEYQDGIAQSAMEWMYQHNFGGGADPVYLVYDLLWTKRHVAKQPISSLDKAQLFSRAGVAVFRESWELTSGGVVTALFKSTPIYYKNHSHRDVNSFELSFNNNLALDSGYYDYYKSPHWKNYYTQTVAHNSLIFERKTKDGSEFIGQENRDAPKTLAEVQSGKFNSGSVTEFENSNLYGYAKGIAGQTYPTGLIDKFDRHFVFLREVAGQSKPVVVIFDDTHLLDVTLKPTWLLHCLTQPQSINEHEWSCTNQKSRLDLSIILPQQPKVALVGGQDSEFVNNGINYPTAKPAPALAGSWRIELQNKETVNASEPFLVVLSPVNNLQQKTLKPINLDSHAQNWRGVTVGNWEVIFTPDLQIPTLDFTVNSQQYVLLAGLLKNQSYIISQLNNNRKAVEMVSTNAGTLLLKTTAASTVHLQKR